MVQAVDALMRCERGLRESKRFCGAVQVKLLLGSLAVGAMKRNPPALIEESWPRRACGPSDEP